jgi:hypothetical protein
MSMQRQSLKGASMNYGPDVHGDSWRTLNGARWCRYCGSMHPDDFFRAIEEGAEITGTDKNYKVYVSDNRKFYFEHFDTAAQQRFIDLYNAKKLNLEPQFGLYVAPFFMRFIPKE